MGHHGYRPGRICPTTHGPMANSLGAILTEPEGKVDLERVLNQAYSKTKVKGASTACILTLIDNVCLPSSEYTAIFSIQFIKLTYVFKTNTLFLCVLF
jgi:hypothetical protein